MWNYFRWQNFYKRHNKNYLRSLSTFIKIKNPIRNNIIKEAMPNLGEEKIYAIVPYKTGPKNEVTFPEKE